MNGYVIIIFSYRRRLRSTGDCEQRAVYTVAKYGCIIYFYVDLYFQIIGTPFISQMVLGLSLSLCLIIMAGESRARPVNLILLFVFLCGFLTLPVWFNYDRIFSYTCDNLVRNRLENSIVLYTWRRIGYKVFNRDIFNVLLKYV